jgi:hypothetical protein
VCSCALVHSCCCSRTSFCHMPKISGLARDQMRKRTANSLVAASETLKSVSTSLKWDNSVAGSSLTAAADYMRLISTSIIHDSSVVGNTSTANNGKMKTGPANPPHDEIDCIA